MPGAERVDDLVAQRSQPLRGNRDRSARRSDTQKSPRFDQTIELARGQVARHCELRQIDHTFDREQVSQRLRRVSHGERLEHRQPRRLPAPSTRRERIDDASTGQGVPGGVVAQHRPVAAQRTHRVFEIELHETAVARGNLPRPEHRGATDGVCRAEVQMDRQPVAQRSFGVTRDAQ